MAKERLDYIDRAKGWLIILTVIGHIWQTGYVHNVIYAFHMPAFFVISGILMSHTKSHGKNYTEFVKSRVYIFGIPFILIEVLGCLTDIMRNGITLNIKGYIFNTLTLNYNDSNLWFLVTLFFVEIIFVSIIRTIKKEKYVMILCCYIFFISAIMPRGNSYIGALASILRYLLFFMLGFYGKEQFNRKNKYCVIIATMITMIIAFIFGKRGTGDLSISGIAFLFSSLCGTYAILQFGKIPLKGYMEKFVRASGENTIIIYGTHHIYYAIVGVILGIKDYATTPIWAGIVMLFVVIVLEIPTIYIINRWLPFLAGRRIKTRE